ncbi:MAG: 23S rRNA (pseudouridine(1915)-N(3))-methyltransferase RlmH [Gemmatimonadota bacterium]
MKVAVVVVGRVRGPLASAVADYEERAARYWKLELVEVDEGVKGGRSEPDRVRTAEAERILARVPEDLELFALTRDGKGMASATLSRHLQDRALRSAPGVAFVIGGAFGLDGSVLARARKRLSLSPMTLPHDMARLVLAEQLYRAGTIARGEPYHKA